MNEIRIVIADDHPLFRNGITALLDSHEQFRVVGEASDGQELLEVVARHEPDVVITDIRMPDMDGIEATKILTQRYHGIKIIALSMHDEEKLIAEILKAGASAYLLKNTDKNELIEAILAIMRGEMFFNHSISTYLLSRFISRNGLQERRGFINRFEEASLTEREQEILNMIVNEELTNEKIAHQLSISKRTVDTHRKNLLLKLGVNNTVGLVKAAYKLGYIKKGI